MYTWSALGCTLPSVSLASSAMSPCRTIVSCARPEMVPLRLSEPLGPSGARVDASDRFRACPRRPGVDVEDDDLCEKEGDALDPGADVGCGAGWCGP